MPEGTEFDNDDADVLAALHWVYIESLPGPQRAQLLDRPTPEPRRFTDLGAALGVIAATKRLDRLQKWHVVSSALTRDPDLWRRTGTLAQMARVVESPVPGGVPRPIDVPKLLEEFASRRKAAMEPPEAAARPRRTRTASGTAARRAAGTKATAAPSRRATTKKEPAAPARPASNKKATDAAD